MYPFSRRITGRWTLVKQFHAQSNPPPGRGLYHETHVLRADDGVEQSLPGWEWADVDGNRLVWAEQGCIMAGNVGAGGLEGHRVLFDANPMEFVERLAPYASPAD